jgi:1-acyl-sn-glycerol-3-phosphate acyltransferase
MIALRTYLLGRNDIRQISSIAKAAAIARQESKAVDILKDGRIVGMKPEGENRISWIEKPWRK